MDRCDHCLIEIPDQKAIHDRVNGENKSFCCHGCMAIYRLIRDEGLTEFYLRRGKSWRAGPPEARQTDIEQFRSFIKHTDGESELTILIGEVRCASCIWLIERVLRKSPGITYARLNYATHTAVIRWDPSRTDAGKILARISAIGYRPIPASAGEFARQLRHQQKNLLLRFGTASFFSMQLMMYSIALYAGFFQGIDETTRLILQLLSLAIASPVLFYSGMPIIRGALTGLRQKALSMDVLILTGAGSAYLYSIYQIMIRGEVYFDTASMIITLILLGRFIESGARSRASDVITRLLSLAPSEARMVVTEAGEGVRRVVTREISLIRTGDLIEIRPGERIPLDGVVVEGRSEIDESMLTGESKPVSKQTGSQVLSGTFNLNGNCIFRVTGTGKDTVLSRIIAVIEDVQMRQAQVQALADRVVAIFVPTVLVLSMITGVSWLLFGSSLTDSVMKSVAVLVIACPCALGLATPLAILTGTTKAASMGIMIKGGNIVERARNVNSVILDKTGAITEGRMRLASFTGIGISDDEALRLAASLERFSEHSVAGAITSGFSGRLYTIDEFRAIPGSGASGRLNGHVIKMGRMDFIEEAIGKRIHDAVSVQIRGWIDRQESEESSVVYLSLDKDLRGIFAVSDTIRDEAARSVQALKDMGIEVSMVTGDNERVALSVAEKTGLGIVQVLSGVLPVDKAAIVAGFQNSGRKVMMVGDGINDAPALVQADVGVAMGRATDIALESADIVLMHSDLMLLPVTVRLCRQIYRIVRQNLFWSFIYNIVALPLAAAGMLHPIIAAGAMTLSSLTVVANSMLLGRGRV